MSTADREVYLYALAPTLVVVAVGPGLALFFPGGVSLGPLGLAGIPVVAAGLVLAVWAVHTFARARATPSPVDTPDRLVTGGPFEYTRNPIYLGTVLAALGEGVFLESVVVLAYGGALWLTYHLLAVYHEEPALREAHGGAYERYRDRVPRWF